MRRTTDVWRPLTAHNQAMRPRLLAVIALRLRSSGGGCDECSPPEQQCGPRCYCSCHLRNRMRLRRKRHRLDKLTAEDRARIGSVGQNMRASLEALTERRKR